MQDRVIAKQLKKEQNSVVDIPPSRSVSLEKVESAAQHLKRTRTTKKLSLVEIAADLKISEEYLVAIEETQLDRLPPQVYTLGFIRSYAHFLGLDGKELVAQYKAALYEIDPPQLTASLLPLTQEKMLVSTKTLVISLVSIAILMALGWYFGSFRNQVPELSQQEQEMKSSLIDRPLLDPQAPLSGAIQQHQSALLPSPLPPTANGQGITSPPVGGEMPGHPSAEAEVKTSPLTSSTVVPVSTPVEKMPGSQTEQTPSSALPAAPDAIVIKAQKESWVRITKKDGTMPVDRTLKAGESVSFSLKEGAFLSTGNAGGLLIESQGKLYQLKGKMGEVKTNISLAPKAFLDYLDRVLP